MVVEINIKASGKTTMESAQLSINLHLSWMQFCDLIIIEVREILSDGDEITVKLSWKWEKWVLTQSTVKRIPTPYIRLINENNWEAVQHVIRESENKKTGLINMVLHVHAELTSFNVSGSHILPIEVLDDENSDIYKVFI